MVIDVVLADRQNRRLEEISFKRVASCNGGFCTFVLNIKEGTQERHNCKCHFEAGQESELVELLFILKNPSLPSHQAIRGEAEGNPAGAEAMTKDSEVVTNETLQDLSGNLPKEWRDVGRKLKLEEADICNIEENNRNKLQKEVIYQMLLLWKQKRGMAATNKALINALREAGRQDLHDNFLKLGKFENVPFNVFFL
ncbi:hypothetical protein BSL78_07447 [Apostichopus japonicus]|uniref:Death domain-containing protein n=1 Tax=Stichopus japonicus TaxID=307972 RepID=A0A2G8L5W8_STIJA|nr:hypothetical protein BSL78_07447 [Apostichopus japonicus]